MTEEVAIVIFTSIDGIAQYLYDADPTLPIKEVKDDALSGYGGTVEFDPSSLNPETVDKLKQAVILISEPSVVAQLLEHDANALSSLRWCQSTYAGVDPIFNFFFPSRSISFPLSWTLTRFAGCFGPPIAEWVLARIISHERNFAASSKDQLNKSWAGSKEILEYRYLSSLSLAILGCGDIGRCIGFAAKAFGMKTIGFGKTARESNDKLECIDVYTTNLTESLQSADYIVSVLPSTPETRGLLNDDALLRTDGKCPVFLNVGRGDVISEASLLQALDKKWLSAAILDVFEIEPLPEESELWTRHDVTISPHVSGLTQGKDVPKVFLENYERWKAGKDLLFVVDWMKGY